MDGGAPGNLQGEEAGLVPLLGNEQLGVGHDPVLEIRLGKVPLRVGDIIARLPFYLVQDVFHALISHFPGGDARFAFPVWFFFPYLFHVLVLLNIYISRHAG